MNNQVGTLSGVSCEFRERTAYLRGINHAYIRPHRLAIVETPWIERPMSCEACSDMDKSLSIELPAYRSNQ